ncbi:MAG: hypothetical protein ACI8P9_002410 [Parasphingorhabdus sp.]|jgi:hypothetical protein
MKENALIRAARNRPINKTYRRESPMALLIGKNAIESAPGNQNAILNILFTNLAIQSTDQAIEKAR